MDNDNAQFSQMNTGGTALFLKQPPKIMGLNSYFMEPPNIGGTIGTGDGGEYTPILREVYNLRTATQSSLLQFQNNTLNTMEDLQHEVIEIRKSVADINKILNKSIKQQEKFQEEQFKRQKLADRYQKQLDNQNRKYKFSTPSMSKSIARGTGNVASDIVGGLLDTLLPGFSRAGGTKLIMKGIKAGTTGLIGLLFGTKTSDKVQKQITTSLGDTIGLSPSSKGKKTNISGLFKNMSKLFSGKKGGRTITADVLDEAGNVVGKTTATVQSKKVGFIGRMFGQASDYTKNLFRSFNKNMITKPSTALSTSVKTAGTSLVTSFGNMGKSMTSIATKGMGTAMAGLGRAIATAGAALVSALSNPWVLGGVIALALGGIGLNKFMNKGGFGGTKKYKQNVQNMGGFTGDSSLPVGKPINTPFAKMSVSEAGLKALKQYEGTGGFKSYKDQAGVWTIGYGHTGKFKGKPITAGMTITPEEADELFRQDVARFSSRVGSKVKVPISQGQFDALTSFAYNVGENAFSKSTLLAKLNKGDYAGAQAEFAKWKYAGGSVSQGLANRRAKEATMFGNTAPSAEEQKKGLGVGGLIGGAVMATPLGKLGMVAGALTASFMGLKKSTDEVQETQKNQIQEVQASGFTGSLSSNPAFSSEQDFYSTVALRTMDKRASGYDSTASGISEYQTQMDRQAKADRTGEIYEFGRYDTQEMRANQYSTPPIQINGDSSVSTPDINMTMLEFIQLQLQS